MGKLTKMRGWLPCLRLRVILSSSLLTLIWVRPIFPGAASLLGRCGTHPPYLIYEETL